MDINHRLFRYLSKDTLKGLGIFCVVITIVNILATIVSYSIVPDMIFNSITINEEVIILGGNGVSEGAMSFAGSNLFAIFVFFIVYGIVVYYENFSLAGGFGITRKNFYLHVVLINIIIVAISAVFQITLLKIDTMVLSNLGYEPLVDFGLFNMNDPIILNILLLGFSFLVFTSLTNLIGVLQYRFGAKFWIGLGIFILLMTLFSSRIGILFNELGSVTNAIANGGGFFIGTLVIIFSYGLGFILIRKVNVK